MKLLERADYYKVIEPLKRVTINNLFARSVVEHKVSGKIFVEDEVNPKTYYVIHPYGMTLLFGESANEDFNKRFRDYALNTNHTRNKHEWMQAYPGSWDSVLRDLFEDCLVRAEDNNPNKGAGVIELNTRVNFRFDREKFLELENESISPDKKIVRTDRQIFRDMKGSVVPSQFWDNEDDFLRNGIGFSLFYKNRLASTAYSSFIHDDKLELGIETLPEFRGKGFAENVCAALIDYCLKNNYEPVWACRLGNTGSYRLAQKIGFVPSVEIPYYRLSK